MRTSAVAAGTLFAATASAVDGVVQWNIERRSLQQPKLRKRAGGTFEEVITNEVMSGGYFTSCQVGTPPQAMTLQLDTGSSDIWVPSNRASVCSKRGGSSSSAGCNFGSFDTAKSETFNVVGPSEFQIAYVDGSKSQGDYFTDAFEIGGANLKNLTMGLGKETDIPYGLVGVGYAANEAIVSSTRSAYPNLPVSMVDQGLIKTNAYSLWLNDLDASTGNILFGGVDVKKYKGDMTRINVYREDQTDPTSNFTSFLVAMTSLQAFSPSGSDKLTSREFPIPVVLDSGTTLSYLPTKLASQIWKEVGAVWSPEIEMAVLPCKMKTSKGFFSFGFAGPSGPKINVTMDELVLDLTTGPAPTFTSGQYRGQDVCEFGIQNFSSSPFLLGDTFLRSAYVVYDLVNNEIGIAPTDFNSTTTNIVAFPSSGATIPSSTPAPNQNQVGQGLSDDTPPGFAAQAGFTGSASLAASLPAALDLPKMVVMVAAVGISIIWSGAVSW